jgi:hypothetical protein
MILLMPFMRLCFVWYIILYSVVVYASNNQFFLPLKPHLKYQPLSENPEKIDTLCQFKSEKQKLQIF